MYKSVSSDIKKYNLSSSLHALHKDGHSDLDFGMDNDKELLDGVFGIYSTGNTKSSIGPIKSEYYRIALVRKGTAQFSIGLESFNPERNYLIFGFPGQIFSLKNPSSDFFTYYMLFADSFINEKNHFLDRNEFPFLTYSGRHYVELSEADGDEIESLIKKINNEIKQKKQFLTQVIKQYVYLIYHLALRSYSEVIENREIKNPQFSKFLKLVSEHYLTKRKASDYASLLCVGTDHLNRIVRSQSDKTTSKWIDIMILQEAKALLRYTDYSVNEVAYKLHFADPSYFIKFFKKMENKTPVQYRSE